MKGNKPVSVFAALAVVVVVTAALATFSNANTISTTLDGPFQPLTAPYDAKLRGKAVDLPNTDPRLRRRVRGFQPEQISVSLSVDYDSVWISWVTGDFQIGYDIVPLNPESVSSVVRFGRRKHFLTFEATGYSTAYSQLYPFEGLQNYTSGIIHHVRLRGLKPQKLYYYKCGDPTIGFSNVYFFKTMPESNRWSYPNRIAIVGDLGLTYNTTTTISHLINNKPDLVLMVGDMSYANMYLTNGTGSDCYSCSFAANTPIHETYQPRWDYWGRYMQGLVSRIPVMVVEGNHEREDQIGGQTYVAYSSRFAFPSEESGSSSTFYYSFNAGGIHFIMLGAYTAYNKSTDQYKWLEKDLANLDRLVTPWLVAVWHPPWYSSYKAHYREVDCMRVEMEELLYSHSVDIVFNGHVHAYERSNRVFNYTLDPCGPVYITIGDGGNREKMAVEHADDPGKCPYSSPKRNKHIDSLCAKNFTSGPAEGSFCWDRQPDFSAFRESSFGHGILEVKNETWALWSWHRNQDADNKVGDQIYIVRQPELCPLPQKKPRRWYASI